METFEFVINLDKIMSGRFYHQSKHPQFGVALEKGLELGYKEVADGMTNKLIDNLALFGLADSDLIGSVDIEFNNDGISLILNDGKDGYATFVEYGTGIVGADSPHPQPSRNGWVYDINEHGEEGWWYPSRESDPNPTKYLSKSGQWMAWTKGMPSRPFMYMTWRWTSSRATQIISKHISAEFRKLERKSR